MNTVKEVRDAFERISREQASQYGAALNEALEAAEDTFKSKRMGVEAEVELRRDRDAEIGTDYVTCLCFGKWGSKWRLFLSSGLDGDESENWACKAVTDASVDLKMDAADNIPKLYDALMAARRIKMERFKTSGPDLIAYLSSISGAS